ncbi:MAG TPA: hypothetical protein VE152_02190 [Acidimicrobiales bacterium]|nr:hypothetical protein [Acidimicrobiales bacterium]
MAQTRESSEDQGIPKLGAELWELLVAYFKQETVQPIKGLGRYVAFGLVGSLLLGTGLVFLDAAALRAMQEGAGNPGDVFYGAHSWMPYAVCALGTAIVLGLAALRILRGRTT